MAVGLIERKNCIVDRWVRNALCLKKVKKDKKKEKRLTEMRQLRSGNLSTFNDGADWTLPWLRPHDVSETNFSRFSFPNSVQIEDFSRPYRGTNLLSTHATLAELECSGSWIVP